MNNYQKFFEGRKLLIATKHKKEQVIQPLLEKHLKVQCIVIPNLDTDSFGTFCGEIERKDDPKTTLKNKCTWAMKQYGYDLAVASEGSFGAHPSLFFIPANDELMVLIDTKNKLEIEAREISTVTNFNGAYITTEDELKKFAEKVLFSSHAIIFRESKESKHNIIKGITTWDELFGHFKNYKQKQGGVFVETDMRAMYNPTRMGVIQKATKQLIKKIKSPCPVCLAPGFTIATITKGLPCNWCNMPTNSILSYTYQCKKCGYTKKQLYPNQKTKADPATCNYCNP